MTPRRVVLVVGMLATVAAVCLQMRLAGAYAEAGEARTACSGTAADIAKLHALRAQWRGVVAPSRPSPDLIGLVQQALVAAGLPITACGAVQPRGDQSVANSRAQVQTVVVNLIALTPGETGAFLAALRAADPTWRVAELQFAANPGAGALDSQRFAITVVLQTTFLEEPT